jgi:hypothetical protein
MSWKIKKILIIAIKSVDVQQIKSLVECAFERIEREDLKKGYFSFVIPRRVPA